MVGGAAMARAAVGPEEIVAAVARFAADRLVERMQKQERIHARGIPGGLHAGQHWDAAVLPQAVAIQDEERPVAQERQGVLHAAAALQQPLLPDDARALVEMLGDLLAEIMDVDHYVADAVFA